MGSAPKCIFSLIFISLALSLFTSHRITSVSSNLKPSNEASSTKRIALSRFRSLLGLRTHNATATALPPSPAPSQLVRKPFSRVPFRAKTRAPPSPHHVHREPTQSSPSGKHGRSKTVAIATCLSLVILMMISLGIFLLCKRPEKKNSHGKRGKVSVDPGPELFYLNSLTHFADTHDSNHVKLSSETMRVETTFLSSPWDNGDGEVIVRCEGDNSSCSDGDTLSFHSARASDLSELPQHHLQASISPSNSSYRSVSPMHRTNLKTIRFAASPCTQHQEADAFPKFQAQDCGSPYEMRIPAISHPKVSFLSNKSSHGCSHSQPRVLTESREMHSHKCPIPKPSSGSNSTNMYTPFDTDPSSEILSGSELKGISPPQFAGTPENSISSASDDSSELQFPSVSPPRVAFMRNTRIQISKTNNSPSSPSELKECVVSNPNGMQSLNITQPESGSIRKPPQPPPPPPPVPPRKNVMSQKPCKGGRLLAPSSSLMQLEETGNGGSALPKLKPLHWDKVRAVPERSMVWDKIRSSSFEYVFPNNSFILVTCDC